MLGRWLFFASLLSPLPAAAASDATTSVAAPAFGQEAEPAQVLAGVYGGAGFGSEATRRLADANAPSIIQQIGRTSGVAMDNWWAQTGAALIDNNLLAQR